MPSPKHGLLVELFRQQPALAPALLRICAHVETPGEQAFLVSSDLSQTMPTEYRTDALVVMRDDSGVDTAAIVVEVQLAVDPDKRFTWPLYVAASRARFRCPVTLLVIAPDARVASWARTSIDVGTGWSFRPTVIDFERVPRVVDPRQARDLPELAVISALAHPEARVAFAALAAIDAIPILDGDFRRLYWDSVMATLPLAARKLVEQYMLKDYEYQSDFFRSLHAQEAAAEAKGQAAGQAEGVLRALLVVLRQRFGDVPQGVEERLRTLDGPARDRILQRVLTAASFEELLAD